MVSSSKRGIRLGTVSSIEVAGIRLVMHTLDHEPPHFHAIRPGEWEIKVWFMECTEAGLAFERVWPPESKGGPSRRHREAILRAVLANRAALLHEWTRKVKTS